MTEGGRGRENGPGRGRQRRLPPRLSFGLSIARLCGRTAARVYMRFEAAGGTVLAGHIAYSAMLALFPFLIFATALTGFLIGPEGAQAALETLFDPFPEHVRLTLEPTIEAVIGSRRSGVLTVSALVALVAASSGLEALRLGLDAAYPAAKPRGFLLNRLYLLLTVVLAVLAFVALAVLIVLPPLVFHLVERHLGIQIPFVVDIARYAAGALFLYGVLWLTHRLLPSRRTRGMRLGPGVVVSILLWGLVASGLSAYLAFAPSYTITYGALAGVVLALLFFYLTGVAVLIGAHVNAMVNGLPPPEPPAWQSDVDPEDDPLPEEPGGGDPAADTTARGSPGAATDRAASWAMDAISRWRRR